MSTTFDLTLIEGMQNCGLSGHEATVRGATLRRNKVAVIFDFSGGSHCDSTDDEDDYDSLDDLNLESMVLNQNSGQLSQEEQWRRHCEKHGKNFTEVYHRQYILEKVKQLKKEDKWMGVKDWETDINAIFKEGDRISGDRAYQLALEYGMPCYNESQQCVVQFVREHHRKHILDKVAQLKKEDKWMGVKDWETDINAIFKEGDRITGDRAYQLALEYGMPLQNESQQCVVQFVREHHRKHILDKVAQLKKEGKRMGEKDWETDINAIFKEGDRITGKRAYEIALECGMKRVIIQKRRRVNVKEHHRQYIQKSVIEKKKRWTGDDDWETDINANFKEGDRISGASARKIALEYGMHSKQNQKLFDSLAESKTPACGWCLNYFGKLYKCPACNSVRYCDRKCQNAHWGEHSKECQKK